jgi:hypothetical protein
MDCGRLSAVIQSYFKATARIADNHIVFYSIYQNSILFGNELN